MSTNGKRNRSAGHAWERRLAEIFKDLGYEHVVTTRSESRARDNSKIDLMNKDERYNGQFPFNVQAKNKVGNLRYAELLAELPKEEGIINVVLHKKTQKVGTRFLPAGHYAVLRLYDFLTLLQLLGVITPEMIKKIENDKDTKWLEGAAGRGRGKKVLPGATGVSED